MSQNNNLNETESKIGKLVELDISKLVDMPNHPFRVLDDTKMAEMADSVKNYGVLVPLLVRPMENDKYQIVAGHRRKRASILAETLKAPCIVKEMTDDEAIIVMVDSNIQREDILPSEKAFAYKMKLDALKRQGKRNDLVEQLTSDHDGPKLKTSIEQLVDMWGDSITQIKRYIRLTYLIPDLLEIVNTGKISLNIGAEISFLKKEEQEVLLDAIQLNEATPSKSQAQKLKKLSQKNQLTIDEIHEIMMEEKGNQKDKYEITYQRFEKYVPRNVVTPKEVETYLLKCAAFCKQNGINVDRVDVSERQKSNTKNRDAR